MIFKQFQRFQLIIVFFLACHNIFLPKKLYFAIFSKNQQFW